MMIVPAGVKVHLALGYTDMRKGMDGLAMLVQETLKKDPFCGHLFAFRGKRAQIVKILFWDGNGLCLFTKRLDRGGFVWPRLTGYEGSITLSPAQHIRIESNMRFDLENLPSDTALLHRLVREMADVVESRDGEIERLQIIIKKLQRAQFGRRSERLDADQLALALEDLDGDIAHIRESRPAIATEAAEAPSRRKPLPDHLPREDVLLDVDSEICSCCGGPLHAIGESVSEMLDWVPAQLRVVRISRRKYACRACNKVVQAPAPERLIAGVLATPALLAQVLVRNIAITRRFTGSRRSLRGMASISVARRSSDGLVERAGGWKRCMNGCARTCSPPTICSPMTRRSQYLIPAGGERRRGDCGSMPASNDRGADPNRRLRSICMRRIAKQNGPPRISKTSKACCTSTAMPASNDWPTTATSCLRPVGRTQGASSTKWPRPPARRWRPKHCAGSENSISSKHAYVGNRRLIVLLNGAPSPDPSCKLCMPGWKPSFPASPAAAHLPRRSVMRSRAGKGLTRFLHDGRIELDTNPVERAIRPVALGRKNHLFAGSDGGVERWAIICSLIETCKLNGVEPYAYLHDVLTRMVDGHPVNRLDELLPWAWKNENHVKT